MDTVRRDAFASSSCQLPDALTLADLLASPLVHQLMRADRIGPEHVLAAVAQARGPAPLKELAA
jgi:hypothetical protein